MIAYPPNLQLERALVSLLKDEPDLADLAIVPASDRSVLVPPLHCFVYCDTCDPQLPSGPIYKANVAVTLVTNIDEHTTEERQAWWTKVMAALRRDPPEQEFDREGITVKGWSIKVVGEISQGQQTGDVARLTVGLII